MFFKFALILSCIDVQHQNRVLPCSYPNHSIFLLRFHRSIYPGTYNLASGNAYHLIDSSNSSKDISLLDCMELQYSCCDSSFSFGIRILRFHQFIFIRSLILMDGF